MTRDTGTGWQHVSRSDVVWIALGILPVLLLAAWDAPIDFGTDDEGLLWYGMQRLSDGEVPQRDFTAYGPARYVWSYPVYALAGESLTGVLVAAYLAGAAGITVVLWAMRSSGASVSATMLTGAGLAAWVFPRHKAYDFGFALGAVALAYALARWPTRRLYFVSGLVIPLALLMGRNHALYLTFALGLVGVLRIRDVGGGFTGRVGAVVAGAGVGISCLGAFELVAPGYWRAIVDQTLLNARSGSTNLPLPVPWPWRAGWGDPTALGFLVLPLLLAGAMCVLWRLSRPEATPSGEPPSARSLQSLLLAGFAVGLPYLHHAFARADTAHLAQAAPGALVAAIALARMAWHWLPRRPGRVAAIALVVLAWIPTLDTVDRIAARRLAATPEAFVTLEVGGSSRPVWQRSAALFQRAEELDRVARGPGFIAPTSIGVYAWLGQEAPARTVYFAFPATVEAQLEVITDLEAARVGWAIVNTAPVGGTPGRVFPEIYPLVWDHLERTYTSYPSPVDDSVVEFVREE